MTASEGDLGRSCRVAQEKRRNFTFRGMRVCVCWLRICANLVQVSFFLSFFFLITKIIMEESG